MTMMMRMARRAVTIAIAIKNPLRSQIPLTDPLAFLRKRNIWLKSEKNERTAEFALKLRKQRKKNKENKKSNILV